MDAVAPVPLLSRSFWRLLVARFFSTFATQMLSIVVGWQVYAQTQSALALGAVGLAEAVPALSLALWAGLQVDHGNPERIFRRVLRCTWVAVTGLLLAFVWVGRGGAQGPLAALYLVSACTGAARAYYQPCMTVLLPRLVSRRELPRAAAWGSSSMQLARVLGPGLGGLLYSVVGPLGSLQAVSLLLFAALCALGRKNLVEVTRRIDLASAAPDVAAPAAPVPPLWTALLEGVHYVRRQPILLSALTLDMVCVFFGSVTALLPIFAEQILHCGPRGLGVLRASPALGGAVASVLLTRADIRPRAGRALLWAVAGFGLCSLAFATSHNFYLSWVILFASGMLDSVSVLVRQLIVQLMSPAHMRGRISSVNAMFVGSSNEIGEFESGVAAAALGVVPSIVFGSSICLLVVATVAVAVPALRRLDLRKTEG